MRVLTRYLLANFAVTFGLTLAVITFVMYVGALMQAIDLLAQGVSGLVILQIMWFNVPYLLSFSIPMSALTATLLLFGRLSIDGEITALRASGLSLTQVVAPILLFAVGLTFFCLYLNFYAAPDSRFERRQAKVRFTDLNPLMLLEEGRFNYDFPGIQIYAGQIRSEGIGEYARLKDVIVNEISAKGLRRNVKARSGTIEIDKAGLRMNVELRDVTIEDHDPAHPEKVTILPTEVYTFNPSYEELVKNKNISKGHKDLTLPEILLAIRSPEKVFPKADRRNLGREKLTCMVEFHKRVANAATCFAFTLLGIPLGLKNRRRESSAGIGISLGIVVLFYFFIVVAESLEKHPHLYPDLILWIPVLVFQTLGFVLLRRAA
jgi:lipopolysaccharide export system permease protein